MARPDPGRGEVRAGRGEVGVNLELPQWTFAKFSQCPEMATTRFFSLLIASSSAKNLLRHFAKQDFEHAKCDMKSGHQRKGGLIIIDS